SRKGWLAAPEPRIIPTSPSSHIGDAPLDVPGGRRAESERLGLGTQARRSEAETRITRTTSPALASVQDLDCPGLCARNYTRSYAKEMLTNTESAKKRVPVPREPRPAGRGDVEYLIAALRRRHGLSRPAARSLLRALSHA